MPESETSEIESSGNDSGDNPPEGFVRQKTRGPYTTRNGPVFERMGAEDFQLGIRIRDRHCNGAGIAHGGMLMSFADGLLGTAVFRATGLLSVTIRMNSDFLSPVRPGEWLEGTARVVKAARSVAFCEADLYVGSRLVMKASGIFKLMRKREKD